MKLKKVVALTMAGTMAMASLTACGGGSDTTADTTAAAAEAGDAAAEAGDSNGGASGTAEVTLQVGFENSISEPFGNGPRSSKRNPAAPWRSPFTRIPSWAQRTL